MSNLPDMLYVMGAPVFPNVPFPRKDGHVWFVDGTWGTSGTGKTADDPFETITEAVDAADEGDTIMVYPNRMDQNPGAGLADPVAYAEALTIDQPSLSIIGVSHGRTLGGLPVIKKGSGTAAMIKVRAPGCYIANLGINGGGSTGGGISLYDDGGTTYCAYGTTIENCYFKNCKCHATHGADGGAIYWPLGGAWQIRIRGNRFHKNVADIVVVTTGTSVPEDIVIEDNVFSGPAASVDGNLYMRGLGSGCTGLIIKNNIFPTWPALASGNISKQMDLTACVGILSGNAFGCTGKTFKAAGDNLVPATMFMTNNWAEDGLKGRDA